MTARPADLRHALPRLAPAVMARRNRLLALLHDRRAGAFRIVARAARPVDLAAATAWLHLRIGDRPGCAAPLRLDGLVPKLCAADGRPDGAALARVLEPLEPVLDLIEVQTGRPLHAVAEGAVAPDGLEMLRLAAWPEGADQPRHVLLIGLPDLDAGPDPRPMLGSRQAAVAAAAHVPLRFRLRVGPARLATLSALAPGDLLLAGVAPVSGRVEAGGLRRAARLLADFRIETGREAGMADGGMDAVVGEGLPVEAVVQLGRLSLAEAAGLAAGQLLPVPGIGGSLAVTLLAGGAEIGRGELVAVGEGYAVLVDRLLEPAPRTAGLAVSADARPAEAQA